MIAIVAIIYRNELQAVFLRTNFCWMGAGLACYLVNYLCRAWRIRSYLHQQARLLPDLFRVSCLHGFSAYFLPMRSGDLALPVLLNRVQGVPYSLGGRILFRARMMDLLSLGLLLSSATLFSGNRMTMGWKTVFLGTGLLLAAMPYLLTWASRAEMTWIQKIMARIRPGESRPIRYPGPGECGQSLLIWFWTGCSTYCVIRALGIPLDFMDVWFFATVQLPLQLLPVQGLANSGNHEAGWLIALDLLGVRIADPVSLALASHFLLIIYVLSLGLIALLLPTTRQPNDSFPQG